MNIFDIIGPVMIGPSSSHTAGAARIGKIASLLMKEKIVQADVELFGSFAKTYKGHGTDKALVGGILGMNPDDERIRNSLQIAKDEGVQIFIREASRPAKHPNSAIITLKGENGSSVAVTGASIGGGNIFISQIDGMEVSINGQNDTLIVVHQDMPGIVGKVAEFLGNCGINVCNMALSRETKGGQAILCIAIDGHTDLDVTTYIDRFVGVTRCIMLLAGGK
ncbi:MAG: L-serine ammonia-lyase, iron-sulfur-dependent, subunit beta [Lachnospiraceae bacterium]|jgi:L-serine dehydratase|nr:L-serine ammonia-lyase, iron-sulfur-dependent, subunit beta [Lachnospiraceae bacterium]